MSAGVLCVCVCVCVCVCARACVRACARLINIFRSAFLVTLLV